MWIGSELNPLYTSPNEESGLLANNAPLTDEAVPRIEFDFADLGREEDQVLPTPSLNAVDVGSESL